MPLRRPIADLGNVSWKIPQALGGEIAHVNRLLTVNIKPQCQTS